MVQMVTPAARIRVKRFSLAEVFTKRGYLLSIDWKYPIMLYQKGGNRDETEANRKATRLKFTNEQIERIELSAESEEDVLALANQIAEHGEFADPVQQRVDQLVAEKTAAQDRQIAAMQKQLDMLTAAQGRTGEEQVEPEVTTTTDPKPPTRRKKNESEAASA